MSLEPPRPPSSDAWPPVALPGVVDLWPFALDRSEIELNRLSIGLSDDEQARAARFLSEPVRDRFIAARGMLRAILSLYLGVEPHRPTFLYGPLGKPVFHHESGESFLEFNLAHSADRALLAVSRLHPLGVDLEQIRPMTDLDRMVARCFSPREQAAFARLSDPDRLPAFFLGWTRKEAYLKATGEGLSTPLKHVEVSVSPDAPPALLGVQDRPDEPSRWSLLDLGAYVDPGFAAALVVRGVRPRLRLFPASDALTRTATPRSG